MTKIDQETDHLEAEDTPTDHGIHLWGLGTWSTHETSHEIKELKSEGLFQASQPHVLGTHLPLFPGEFKKNN